MYQYHSIEVVNFRSYRGVHKFEFPAEPGLYFLTGENETDTSLGANGAGKSTFLDAITWALYGQTARGLRASDVLPWGTESGTGVTLELTVGADRGQIKRTQKPNGLFLNDKAVDQTELEKYLRLNFEAYVHAVLFPQFGEPFFSLTPTRKLALFSDIMKLDTWLEYSKQASLLADEINDELTKLRNTLSLHADRIDVLEGDIEELTILSNNFSANNKKQIAQLKESKVLMQKDVTKAAAAVEKYWALKKKCQIQVKSDTDGVREKKEVQENALRALDDIVGSSKAWSRKLSVAMDQVNALRNGSDTVCPTCMGSMNSNQLKAAIATHYIEVKECEDELEIHKKMHEEALKQVGRNKFNLTQATLALSESEKKLKNAERHETEWADILTRANDGVEKVSFQIDTLNAQENPHIAMIKSKKARIAELKKNIAAETKDFHQLEADYEATKYWIKGFKSVRLFIIEQAFQTLEIEVNNSLAQLGLTDWQVTFDIERENKSGGITKGFVTYIKSPYNSEPVKWENWSGGETQRLQLAGDQGLANLIMQQAGLSNSIEFYDEPSKHLSPEGMMDLANMLHERAVSEKKTIWIIDHASITNFGEFEAVIVARKTGNGSSIAIKDDVRGTGV